MTVTVLPSLDPSLIFAFHLLPSTVQPTGFCSCFFPGFLAIFISLSSNNSNKAGKRLGGNHHHQEFFVGIFTCLRGSRLSTQLWVPLKPLSTIMPWWWFRLLKKQLILHIEKYNWIWCIIYRKINKYFKYTEGFQGGSSFSGGGTPQIWCVNSSLLEKLSIPRISTICCESRIKLLGLA